MAVVSITRVEVVKSKLLGIGRQRFRAVAYGGNGEIVATTENYADKRDAMAAAFGIAAGGGAVRDLT